jgi:uncharacterized protein (TIGR00156 family)
MKRSFSAAAFIPAAIALALALPLYLFPPSQELHAQAATDPPAKGEKAPDPKATAPGFKGPGPEAMTVAEALKAKDDTDVSLQGEITRAVGDGKFILKDGTGSVVIDCTYLLNRSTMTRHRDNARRNNRYNVSGDVDIDPNGDFEINVTRIAPVE